MHKNFYRKHRNVNFFFVNNDSYIEDFYKNSEIRQAFLDTNFYFYSTFVRNVLLQTFNFKPKKLNRYIVEKIDSYLAKRFAQNLHQNEKDEAKRLAEALQCDEKDIERALVNADVFNYLTGVTGRIKHFVPSFIAGGCSTIIVSPPQSNTFLIGRNLDFTGVDFWDKEHAIYVYNHRRGIPYILVSSVGATIPLNAINKEGIFIAIHFLYSKHASLHGTPIYSILRELITNVRTLDEGINFLKNCSFGGSWTIIIGSAKERKACACEVNARGFSIVTPEHDYFYYANCYLSEKLQGSEIHLSNALIEHNKFRIERAQEYFSNLESVTPEHIGLFLGDHYDVFTKRYRPFGNVIAALHNLSSVIIAPEESCLWMSTALAPACDTDEYLGFTIDGLYNNEIEDIPGVNVPHKHIPRGIEAYKKAHVIWFNSRNSDEAIVHLYRAVTENSKEPIYKFVLGLFLLKKKKYKDAQNLFAECLAISDSPLRVGQYMKYLEKARRKQSRGIRINTILGEAL